MADRRALHTWTRRRAWHGTWTAAEQSAQPVWCGLARLACGCLEDRYDGGRIWEPCMAHETDGHVSVISRQDSLHVARCLVPSCSWRSELLAEVDAIGAAQRHWHDTRAR